jgi:integrase/recombinase XerD|nr:MAG TPA: SITE SPECIFIC RECOMBINASE XERD [Caudoviricetes sp.]
MKTKITMNSSKNLSVESAYELFIRKCRVKNLSEATITSYNNKVIPFVEFCNGGDISAVTVDTVDAFTDMLKKEHNVNDVSVVSYLRSVRAFLYYCMECNYMTSFKIHLPKCNKEIKEIYTDEQLEKLLKKPDTNTCSFTEYKTWVFENYLIATGNRLSTALNVQIRDLNFEDGIITLRKTKNRKQQIIPLSASLADVLQEYLVVRGGQPEDYLFCNNYGEQASNRTWQTLVYRYNVKRDVNVTSIHAFRHSFARLWILNHGDIMRLKTILGHSNIAVTNEYLQMFGQDLQMDFEKFNPLDNMNRAKVKIRM